MKPCAWPLLFVLAATLCAHPMGNFSVSHYARIEVSGGGAEIRYVLDLAGIPSFQLLQQWGLSADSPRNLPGGTGFSLSGAGPRPAIRNAPGRPPVPTPATSPVPPQPSAPGTVVRGDFLSRLLHRGDIGLGLILLGMAVAFGLGAMHALSPGHGKTIVAAYLVGSRGTFKHAIFLGGMVTFTHTISVFFLGLTTLFLSQYVLPEKIFPVLGAISGLTIVWIGGMLLYQRARRLRHVHQDHDHDHHHDRPHAHHHGHDREPHSHSHVPEGDITLGSLIALGASGGLVPCPSALVLLLSSIALGRVGLGLLLLIAFSAGLAVVLMGIGVLVLYAKHFLPDSQKTAAHPAFRIIPVLSAALIVCIGLLMTGVSLGWIQPNRLAG